MKVKLERTFAMPASPEVTWGVLRDIEMVAPCMPGAAITERVDAQHYKGTVALKVGPASLKFKGEIEVRELDEATRSLRLVASGTDASGSSAASMDLTARVEATEDGRSQLVGYAEASVSGKVAAFASRMMDAVADQILKQFAANFATVVAAQQPGSPQSPEAAAPSAPDSAAATSIAPAASTAPGSSSAQSSSASASAPGSSPASAAPPLPGAAFARASGAGSASAPPAAPPRELNALALMWAVFKDWLRGLFSKKST